MFIYDTRNMTPVPKQLHIAIISLYALENNGVRHVLFFVGQGFR